MSVTTESSGDKEGGDAAQMPLAWLVFYRLIKDNFYITKGDA